MLADWTSKYEFYLSSLFHSLKNNIMAFLKEFKTFISNGNVIELAVGVIIGAAFGSIVSSLVDDIVTPLLLNPALKAANVKIGRAHV